MTSFNERLAAAKARPRPHRDVKVYLDADLGRQQYELNRQLEAAKKADEADQRLGSPNVRTDEVLARIADIADAARDAIVMLRFRRMDGHAWADLTSKHPARTDVPIDMRYGYNYDAVSGAAAVTSGRLIELENGEEIEVELEPTAWLDLFTELAGADVERIRDAIWTLNEYEPAQHLDALVKGFGATTRSETK